MTAVTAPDAGGAHLVGSVPMDDAESVFRAVAGALGPHLRRIPDGETGERRRWIFFQNLMLRKHPDMEEDPTVPPFALRQWDGKLLREMSLLRFRPGVDPGDVRFETGYAAAAHDSYAVFARLQSESVIPAHLRFQVSLPTPMASGYMYVSPRARDAYLPAYERALRRALDVIVAAVPPARLSIQWDVCQEVLVHEGFFPDRPADYARQIEVELARLGDAVPEAVEMGYHLCYGSPADEHLVMPKDLGVLVEMTRAIRRSLRRRMDFLHLPVPRDRADDAYFRPLERLDGLPSTALYLGLIHHADEAGDMARHDRRAALCAGLRRGVGVRVGPYRSRARAGAPRQSPLGGRAARRAPLAIARAQQGHEGASTLSGDGPGDLERGPTPRALEVGAAARAVDQVEVQEGLPVQVEHAARLLDHARPGPQGREHVPEIIQQRRRAMRHPSPLLRSGIRNRFAIARAISTER